MIYISALIPVALFPLLGIATYNYKNKCKYFIIILFSLFNAISTDEVCVNYMKVSTTKDDSI